MPSVHNPTGLISEQNRAFAEKVASHTTVIINGARTTGKSPGGQSLEEEGVGMGSACVWNGRKIILTARHVLAGANPQNLRFFLRQGGKINRVDTPAQPSLSAAVSLEVEDIVTCESDDVGCIVLSARAEDRLNFATLPGGLGRVPSDGSLTLLYGCPYDQNIPVTAIRHKNELHVGFAARPRGCWAIVKGKTPRFFPSSFDPTRQFLLHYDPAEEGAMPQGFSGAGVWYQNADRGMIWSAKPVLAGIQISWHKPTNTMIAIRSKIVRRFLSTHFGAG